MLGNRTLDYYPDEGEKKFDVVRYIKQPKPKDDMNTNIFSLNFETYLQGRKHFTVKNEQYDATN